VLFFEAGIEGLDGKERLGFGGLVGLVRGLRLSRIEFGNDGIRALEKGGEEGAVFGKCWEV
jgi:hypothetical protein